MILCAHNESKWIMYFLKIMKSIKGLKRKMWLQKCSALNQKLHPFPWCSFDFVHVPASFSFYSIWHAVRTLHRMSWLHSELSLLKIYELDLISNNLFSPILYFIWHEMAMALDVRSSTMLLNFCNIQSIQLGVAVSTDKKRRRC